MTSPHFLDAVHQGQNHGWRYLLSLFLVLGTWFGSSLGVILVLALAAILGLVPESLWQELMGESQSQSPSLLSFVATNLGFGLTLLALWLAVTRIHQRPFRSLIRARPPLRWRRVALGGGLWVLLLSGLNLGSLLLHPGSYQFQFHPGQWLPFVLVALILTPIQTSAEELFIRGYLLQGFSLCTRQRWLLILASSLVFLVPHLGNPEMGRSGVLMALSYFSLGVFLSLITLRDHGLELALGVHAGNNLAIVALFNTRDSALPSPALVLSDSADPLWGLVALLVLTVLFYGIVFIRPHRSLD